MLQPRFGENSTIEEKDPKFSNVDLIQKALTIGVSKIPQPHNNCKKYVVLFIKVGQISSEDFTVFLLNFLAEHCVSNIANGMANGCTRQF